MEDSMYTQAITSYTTTDFAADVRAGLTKPGQKELLSKYLYDEVGSALFEVITVLPEYGLTRAGLRLFTRHAHDMVARMPRPVAIAELGSGSGKKTRILLEAMARHQPTTYYPIDISRTALKLMERELGNIDAISIVGFERAYLDGLLEVAARRPGGEHLVVLFLGSTIGNFDRPAGEQFVREVREKLQPGDCLLLSTDLEKSIPVTLLAYDDPLGVTAAFNLNLLARINRELGGDFDLTRFRHEARWNESERRVEMHLRSLEDQAVRIPRAALTVQFREGETIWTESSHRYTTAEVRQMAARHGFRCDAQWVDQEWPFAISLFVAV
jgi:L-histidine N-alpha-methyltransferase